MKRKTPYCKAKDKWMRSEEGEFCKGTSILYRASDLEYLCNRLEVAFAAGWNASEKARKR